MSRIEERLARLEREVAALPRARPRGCQPGRTFDPVRELVHVEACRAEDCPRRRRFDRMSEEEKGQLREALTAELARREALKGSP